MTHPQGMWRNDKDRYVVKLVSDSGRDVELTFGSEGFLTVSLYTENSRDFLSGPGLISVPLPWSRWEALRLWAREAVDKVRAQEEGG